jgi:hypothetical protein
MQATLFRREQMPLTSTGRSVLKGMIRKHGKKGEAIFYASINKGVPGSKDWHEGKAEAPGKNKFTEALAS